MDILLWCYLIQKSLHNKRRRMPSMATSAGCSLVSQTCESPGGSQKSNRTVPWHQSLPSWDQPLPQALPSPPDSSRASTGHYRLGARSLNTVLGYIMGWAPEEAGPGRGTCSQPRPLPTAWVSRESVLLFIVCHLDSKDRPLPGFKLWICK